MEFEDILKDVGDFGCYQKTLILVFLIPLYLIMPSLTLDLIFLTSTPEHWCYVPEIDNSNLSLEMQKSLIRPPEDKSCSMYDVNYTNILLTGNTTVDSAWPTTYCKNGWKYDTRYYDATVVTEWNLVCRNAPYSSLVLSMMFIGIVLGTPLYGWMLDKIGRKVTLFFLCSLVAAASISSVFSPYFTLLLVLKLIQGSVMASIYSSGYVILLEMVSPKYRSWVNGLTTTAYGLGIALVALTAWLTRDWILHSMVTAFCAAAMWIYWKFVPESPRWLILAGRYKEAHAILMTISKFNRKSAHKTNKLMQDIEMLGGKYKMQESNKEKLSPLILFRYPTIRTRFLLTTASWIGISVTYYGLQVNVRNLFGNQFLNFALLAVMSIPSDLATWYLLDRIGRRSCSLIASSLCAISCIIPVIISSDNNIVGVIASLLAKTAIGSSYMTIYQQSSEILPTALRGMGMALTSSVGLGLNLLMPFIVSLGEFKAFIPFLIFAVLSCTSLICSFFLPETLNKNLPQTIEDAENFEKNFSYCSCFKSRKATMYVEKGAKNNKTSEINVLSAENLYFSTKAIPDKFEHTSENKKKLSEFSTP